MLRRILAAVLAAGVVLSAWPAAVLAEGDILYDDDFPSTPISWNLYSGTSTSFTTSIVTFWGTGSPGLVRPSPTPWPCPSGAVVHLLMSADGACTVRIRVGTEGQTHSVPGDSVLREYTLTLIDPQSGVNFYRASGTAKVSVDRVWVTSAPGADLYLEGVSLPNGVHLSWSEGTPPYTVARDGSPIGTTSNLYYTDAACPWGTAVVYTVEDSSDGTGTVNLTTVPGAPSVTVGECTTKSVAISWAAVPTAATYRVWRDGALVIEQEGTSYADGNLAPGVTFSYVVAGVSAVGEGVRSAPAVASTIEQPPPPQAPANLHIVTRHVASLDVAWNPVAGVGGYKVYLNGGLYGLSSVPSASIAGLTAGTSYTIAVQAYSGIYDGALSAPLVASTIGVPEQVTGLAAVPGAVTLTVTWGPPAAGDAPTSYNVYLDGSFKASTAGTSYLVTGLTPDTLYSVAVAGVNEAGEGPTAQISSTTTDVQAPEPVTGLAGTATVRTISATWDAYTGATGYQVFLDAVLVGQTSGTSWTFTGLTPDTLYSVAVAAVNEAGPGTPASVAVRTQEGPPIISKVAALGTGYVVTYHGPDGPDAPDSYQVWADDGLRTTAVIPSQFPDPDMDWTTGTNHTIRVDAVYGAVTVSASATVTAYVAVDPVEYPPPASLFESVMQDWSSVLVLVTALSITWMIWDWWRGGRRDPFTPPGGDF